MGTAFQQKKKKILSSLGVSDEDYTDLSPKGSVDAAIRDLINEINNLPGLVTTSSCAGRVSVFLEGQKKNKKAAESEIEGNSAEQGPTGKGGGKWLYVSHDPADIEKLREQGSLMNVLGIEETTAHIFNGASLVHFKFEPMILHILTASLQEANAVLSAANQAGFRESGALGLTAGKDGHTSPMVAVRSAGLSFDSIIGYQTEDGKITGLVDEQYLDCLFRLGNERFEANSERIERFRTLLHQQTLLKR